jgi:hypothetical protein
MGLQATGYTECWRMDALKRAEQLSKLDKTEQASREAEHPMRSKKI